MPVYEYYCENCRRDVNITLSISEHDKALSKLATLRIARISEGRVIS